MRKLVLLFGAMLLAAVSASAQYAPNLEVAGAYQYVHLPSFGNPNHNCQGFGANAALNVTSHLGVVGDFGFCKVTGFSSGDSSHYFSYLVGPRWSFRSYSRLTPYVQFLLGGDHNATTAAIGFSSSASTFAFTAGGGADVRLTHNISIRAIQAEYLYTHFGSTSKQNNLRIETGLIYRFGSK